MAPCPIYSSIYTSFTSQPNQIKAMAIMSAQLIFSLSLVFLVSGAHMATISITNNCPYTVWPGTLAKRASSISETGFELATRGTKTLNILLNGRALGPNAMLWRLHLCQQSVARAKLLQW
ncbi:hypothetical protein Pint_26633 [Pistacia integerrima]|uniref:Uncharacterized protein n=1 Tax=Pistacia integerrima TaxID=434235 RepID=A0ACC0YNG9_9ROSI|nr:hypothetical protein Pint_26633 [Pistacia integerrima]